MYKTYSLLITLGTNQRTFCPVRFTNQKINLLNFSFLYEDFLDLISKSYLFVNLTTFIACEMYVLLLLITHKQFIREGTCSAAHLDI